MRETLSTRRRILKSGAALTGTGLLAGCSGDGNSAGTGTGGNSGVSSSASDGTITVGTIHPQTGPYAVFTESIEASVQIVADRINQNGGVNGNTIEVLNRDSQLDPSTAVEEARDLVQAENADILLGATSSAVTRAITDVAKRNGVIQLNATSASPSLTGEDCSRYFFRFRPTTEHQAIPFCPWLYENVGQTMSIYYSDYAWGQSGLENFSAEFENAGGEVIDSVAVPLGTSDQSSYISNIDTSADILVPVMGGSDAAAFLEQGSSYGIFEEMEVAAPGSDFLGGHLDQAIEGMTIITAFMPRAVELWDTPYIQNFIEEYQNRMDGMPMMQSIRPFDMVNQVFATAESIDYGGRGDTDALIDALQGREFSADDYARAAFIRSANNQMTYEQAIMRAENDSFTQMETAALDPLRDIPTQCEF